MACGASGIADQPPPITHLDNTEIFAEELAYEGAEVAFVVATDERVLEDALAAIEVEYEPLPFVSDLVAAMAPDAPNAVLGVDSNLITPERRFISAAMWMRAWRRRMWWSI